MQRHILVVSHDEPLRITRAALLSKAGYFVQTAANGNEAIALLEANSFSLVVIGRRSLMPGKCVDEQIREKYPSILILKIAEPFEDRSSYVSRTTDSLPANVLAATKELLTKHVDQSTLTSLSVRP